MKKITTLFWNHPFLIFLLFIVVSYFPVFLPFFHLKNDLITQNLPTRFVISESLYSGYFPWWNPYIHYGIPQYGDMNNGFWNPFMWLIAKTIGYSLWTITLEEMFYILIGGWGIFKLVHDFGSKETAIITGFSYMCCGYITGHLQHFIWITGTAFFPYILLFFFRTHKQPSIKNIIGACFSIFFFLSSTHPGIIIGGIYFFIILLLLIYFLRRSFFAKVYSSDFFKINIILFILSLLLSSVVIVSNIEVLRNITRWSKLIESEYLLHPTTFQSYISLLAPTAVFNSYIFYTDISMRNVYIGLYSFIGLLIVLRAVNMQKKLAIISFLSFFILLASGGIFKKLFFIILPGISYVRLNGEFTYFAILIALLVGSIGIDKIWEINKHKEYAKYIYKSFKWIFIFGILISLAFIILKNTFNLSGIIEATNNPKLIIKSLIDRLGFWELLFISSVIQLSSIIIIQNTFTKRNLFVVTSINLILFTWLSLPFTSLGMESRNNISQVLKTFPKGIYHPPLISINQTNYINPDYHDKLLLVSSYSKKIGNPIEEQYPIQLKTSKLFFSDESLQHFINNLSWIFLSTDTTISTKTCFNDSLIQIKEFRPGYVKASIKSNNYKFVTLLQNNYPYWKVKINGIESKHYTSYKTFISTILPDGENEVEFIFEPKVIKIALVISFFWGSIFILLLSFSSTRKYILFNSN